MLSPYTKTVVCEGPRDYRADLNGQPIGWFVTAQQARTELDRVAFEDANRDGLLLAGAQAASDLDTDPALAAFGIDAGPQPDAPVTRQALRAAFVVFCRQFDGNTTVLDRAERALEIDPTSITIGDDGSIAVQGSGTKPYAVTGAGCTCKDFYVRDGASGGMCKHAIRREMIRLAQALTARGLVDSFDLASAYVCIPAPDLVKLGRALSKANAALAAAPESEVAILAANRLVLIQHDGMTVARLIGDDGGGVAHVRLDAAQIARAMAAVIAARTEPQRPNVQIFIDDEAVQLIAQRTIFTS